MGQHSPTLGLQRQDAPVSLVVVHDQHPPPAQLVWLTLQARAHRRFYLWRLNRKVESGALSRHAFAFYPNLPAHHFCQASADGKSQTGAAEAARRRGVYLREALEKAVYSVGGDAYTGVAYTETQAD